MKNSCKVIKKDGETVIVAGETDILSQSKNDLYSSLADKELYNKEEIEKMVLGYKNGHVDKDTLMRTVPFFLTQGIKEQPMYAEKIIFKLKKLGIDEDEIREKIKSEENITLDSVLDHAKQFKDNILKFLSETLKGKPNKNHVFDLISTFKSNIESQKLDPTITSILLKDFINEATIYLYKNKEELNLDESDLEHVMSLNPGLKASKEYWSNYKN